jgi:hypothetical protein
MESSILSEVHNASILRAGLSTDYAVISTSLASQIVAGLSACAPAQRAGAQRLRASTQTEPLKLPRRVPHLCEFFKK